MANKQLELDLQQDLDNVEDEENMLVTDVPTVAFAEDTQAMYDNSTLLDLDVKYRDREFKVKDIPGLSFKCVSGMDGIGGKAKISGFFGMSFIKLYV